MPQVCVTINNRQYRISCKDGQENRLRELAEYFHGRVNRLAGEIGQVGDDRLMLLAALNICDDLFGATDRITALERYVETAGRATGAIDAGAVNAAAERIRNLADCMEKTTAPDTE